MLADELGDVIAYADLVAAHYGIDLGNAVARKFNRVSIREGFEEFVDRTGPVMVDGNDFPPWTTGA